MINMNLVIDGNYMLYRSVFILHKLKTLYGDLESLLLSDYNKLSTSYSFNKIYFISDSKRSWRKDLYAEYKGKRKKADDIDWVFVFDTFDKFKESIKNRHNCLLYQVDPFEGDDIIAHVVNESNKEGYSNYIITADGDIHQLLKFSVSDGYINIVYNHKFNNEKLFVPENYSIFLDNIQETSGGDIFDLDDDMEFVNYLDNVSSSATLVEVNSEESYFKKIVAGDAGDNILSVVRFKSENRGIGDTGASTVYSMYKQNYPEEINFDSNDFVNKLTNILVVYKKNKDVDFKRKVTENIKFSRTLTRLDGKYLPNKYKNKLFNHIKI